ncbi:MAG: geranylgeranylglyceryl/heptaprenylglyceryl phosphate synthase [Candidatus Diapherotrites archaeon]|nr:geranylgeranylglyceryl/heptaprenylglyceryl phosphate synthase [Candidatus Diapherotrites archaeon]
MKGVYNKILSSIKEVGCCIFLVIDPPNQSPEEAGKIAKIAEDNGVKAVAVGGSVGAQGELLDKTILEIKNNSSLPVILFPGNIATLSKYADAIYFMYMMNSLDPYYITGAQIASAMPIKKIGLEVIPTCYTIIEPGRAVGFIGRAQKVPRDLPYLGAISCLAGQYMGAKLAILESGGGAESPAPVEMIKQTKQVIDIPLIVAGGVRNDKFAYECAKAGADILHIGTVVEESSKDFKKIDEKISKIVRSAEKGAKER